MGVQIQGAFGQPLVLTYTGSTNDTASSLPGPGRTLDHVLEILGRSFDARISKAAHKMGLGPAAAVVRLEAQTAHITGEFITDEDRKKVVACCQRLFKYTERCVLFISLLLQYSHGHE